jgi:hypothetical protein
MRKTLGVAALMLAFSCPALAGEIPNPPAPEPPAYTHTQSNTAATTSLIQTVLTVIVSVLP